MSNIKLYGFVIPGVKGEGGYEFEFADIYLIQKNKWLKADSPNFARLSGNADFVKSAKNFGFYTKSEDGSRYTSIGMRYLKDYLEKRPSGKTDFSLTLIAVLGDQSVIVRFSGCALAQSMTLASTVGTIQSHQVNFKDASVEKLAGAARENKK